METHFLLAFGEEEFLAPLAMTGSEAFFNKLLNEPKRGQHPNVGCDVESYDFFALKDIEAGEELTVDYSKYRELLLRKVRTKTTQ